jgi:gliding motility-associated-like protein
MGYGETYTLSQDVNEKFDTCYYEESIVEVCLIAQNGNGCVDKACKILTIYDFPELPAPNIFTPDGDNVNDVFTFDAKQVGIKEFECVITDRWGKEMIVFDSITDSWDGTTEGGREATAGVYFYTYRGVATNGTEFTGQSSLQLSR